jgi:hypothetical protein
MKKRYILVPGTVRSQTDGDLHYIDAPTLARLYGARMEECIVIRREEDERGRSRELYSLPRLRPRYRGDYVLP